MPLYVPTEVQNSINYKYWFILSEIKRISELNGYCTLSDEKLASKFKGLTKQTFNKYINEMVSLNYIEKYTETDLNVLLSDNNHLHTAFVLSMKVYDMFVNDGIYAHEPQIPEGYEKAH